ncbi:DUF4209 domain-containing protein [uncultured Jatrophihabitans sp.]|uniref:DUF4209 domain-containing protein n=1 Tax=uncultured Jatrophihabitans sp. TaxID=1610747 RepID=UPI0035CBED6A
MTEDSNDPASEPAIDPSWWRPVVTEHRKNNPHPSLFALSRAFAEAAAGYETNSLPQSTLNALTLATMARLHPEQWNDPIQPLVPNDMPAGIDGAHFALLHRVADAMNDSDDPMLRARVADLCWWHVDRSDIALRDAAITAYIAVPLEPDSWPTDGRHALRRAVEIIRQLSEHGRSFIDQLTATVSDRLHAATFDDRFFAVHLSEFARDQRLLDGAKRAGLANLAETLAAAARDHEDRNLEQAWEAEAAAWYARDNRRDQANAATERLAESLTAQAEDRRNGRGGAAITASHFVERALKIMLGLPRSYRVEHGIDQRVIELRAKLDDDRALILESMAVIRTDGHDITEYVAAARRHVTGLDPVDALIALSLIHHPADYDQLADNARESLREHPLSHLFGNEHYSATGQKVAATPGGQSDASGGSPETDPALWAVMVRDHTTVIGLVVDALIIPALQTVNLQHQYTLEDLYRLCVANPWIPRGHEATWAQGILHGLNSDFASALAVLTAQTEHLVRVFLKRAGVHTLVTDEHGVEIEKGLSRLLEEPAALDILGPDLLFDMKATFTDKQGPNFRNSVAHGLIGDAAMVTRESVYAWWFALTLAMRPHAASRSEAGTDPGADGRDDRAVHDEQDRTAD